MSRTTICSIPWNHIAVQQNGDYRICCQNIYPPYGKLTTNNNELATIFNTPIQEVRNAKELKDLRLSMLKNERNPLCELCYKEEDANLFSKRKHMNSVYPVDNFANITNSDGSIDVEQFPVRYIDIRFGNLCNLKCRYCGPGSSNLWYDDYATLASAVSDKPIKVPFSDTKSYEIKKINNKWTIDSDDFKWYENVDFWVQMLELIPYIDRYYFTGGEPTVNKAHFELLKLIIEAGYAKNVSLEYNSNMIAIPDKLYDMWGEFKDVGIGCSIDGIHDMANYLRPPSIWTSIEENLDHLGYNDNRHIHGSIATTISVFNILHFLDLSKWLLSKNYKGIKRVPSYHVLEGPSYMSVCVLPLSVKEHIKEQYENFYTEISQQYNIDLANVYRKQYAGIINYMFSEDRSHMLSQLQHETFKLDILRSNSLSDNIPWLFKILKEL